MGQTDDRTQGQSSRELTVKLLIFVLGSALIVLLDQLTKAWAVRTLAGNGSRVLIPGVLQLTYTENAGIAFGLFQNRQWFFVILTVIVLLFIVYLVYRMRLNRRFAPLFTALVFLTGGAVGNMIDRIAHRYVVDFIYFSLIDFPVFNVADIFVTVSCIALILMFIFLYKDEDLERFVPAGRKEKDAPAAAAPGEHPESGDEERGS